METKTWREIENEKYQEAESSHRSSMAKLALLIVIVVFLAMVRAHFVHIINS